jgi:hypothetical protein
MSWTYPLQHPIEFVTGLFQCVFLFSVMLWVAGRELIRTLGDIRNEVDRYRDEVLWAL